MRYLLLGVLVVISILGFFFVSRGWNLQNIRYVSQDLRKETVQGESMQPLIKDGQDIQYVHGYYKDHAVERYDVVIAEVAAHSGRIIKKIVGIPGDTWSYSGGEITLKGEILKNSVGEPYKINSPMLKLYSESYPTIPKDAFLILGDQVGGTLDASKYGFITLPEIVGKVVQF